MGTNKRYPHNAGQLAEQRELRQAHAKGPLQTLSSDQLALHRYPVTIAPEQTCFWVLAWVRFGDADVRCTARLLRWTDHAFGIEVQVDEERLRCWIWQGAARHLNERKDAWL